MDRYVAAMFLPHTEASGSDRGRGGRPAREEGCVVTYTIAVAARAVSGRPPSAPSILRHLLSSGQKPLLAVDADANTNLNEVLGVPIDKTVASLRDELLRTMGSAAADMTKDTWVEYQLATAIVEEDGYDLVAMGKAELSGCYCYVNNLLKRYLELLQGNYSYSSWTTRLGWSTSAAPVNDIDVLFVLSDPSPRGILTAHRIADLVEELKAR